MGKLPFNGQFPIGNSFEKFPGDNSQTFGSHNMIMLYPNSCDIEVVLYKNNLHKIAIIFYFISLNVCFGCSKELSHRDGSFEYPQHMFG